MGLINKDNAPHLVGKLSDGANIKITGNSYGTRVSTVVDKITEKADNVTKAVEQEVVNEGYSFKVGTGDVDVSSSVEDSFGEIGVKGNTYQNLHNGAIDYNVKCTFGLKPSTVYTIIVYKHTVSATNQFNYRYYKNDGMAFGDFMLIGVNGSAIGVVAKTITTPSEAVNCSCYIPNNDGSLILSNHMILEGDHTNNPNLPAYFEGIQGVGDKSKNLFKKLFADGLSKCSIAKVHDNGEFTLNGTLSQHYMFYITIPKGTYSTQVKQELGTTLHVFWTGGDSGFSRTNSITYDVDTDLQCYIAKGTYENTLCKYQIETGTTKSSYEPYYNGHKIEILSNGNNLFDMDLINKEPFFNDLYYYDGGTLYYYPRLDNDYIVRTMVLNNIKPNTKYTLSVEGLCRKEVLNGETNNKFADSIFNTDTPFTFTTPSDVNCLKFKIFYSGYVKDTKYLLGNIQLEESSTSTPYTTYQQDKTQILLEEPLMKLPNGVADEITMDGKLIRRVGKITYNGSESFSFTLNGDDTLRFSSPRVLDFKDYGIVANGKGVLCSSLKVGRFTTSGFEEQGDRISSWQNLFVFYKNGLTLESFKQWLSENPTTVYYELATPIITELEPLKARLFKDGHLTLNTLVAPTSAHKVAINKSAQIENSVKEVQLLDGRVEKLENFYNDMMLQNRHRLDLLGMDFEYVRTIESEDV